MRDRFVLALVTLIGWGLASNAHAALFAVDALANSSSGGIGFDTGIVLSAGDTFSSHVDATDLWSAGALPRWSNADGLTGPLFATGSDESGLAAGTLIGADFGLWTQGGLSAPYGTLVGRVADTYFVLGTEFSGAAPASGTLLLYYWDSNNGDNFGALINVNISVTSPIPEPETYAMLLAGLGLLGFGARRRKLKEAAAV